MAFFSTFNSELLGVYDNEISVTYFSKGNNGKFFGRDALENVHHAGGSPQNHPTLSNVMRNTNGHVFLNGSFVFEWEWDVGGVTEAEMDAYISLVSPDMVNPNITFTKDIANNKLIMTMSDADMQIPSWTGKTVAWHPKAPKAKITVTSDESEFVCVTCLNGTYDDYTFDQITIEPSSSLEITRPDCTVCYVMFSDHVAKDTAVLLGKKMYKVSSPTLNITNDQPNRVRVLRYYK